LLSKNIKIKVYRTIILRVVLYGCETWSLTLREEQRLRVFEKRVLRRIFGPKRDIRRNLMICTHDQILFGWSNKEEWDGRGIQHVGEEERYIQDFGREAWAKETTWKTQA
jgi:hypothetical protein